VAWPGEGALVAERGVAPGAVDCAGVGGARQIEESPASDVRAPGAVGRRHCFFVHEPLNRRQLLLRERPDELRRVPVLSALVRQRAAADGDQRAHHCDAEPSRAAAVATGQARGGDAGPVAVGVAGNLRGAPDAEHVAAVAGHEHGPRAPGLAADDAHELRLLRQQQLKLGRALADVATLLAVFLPKGHGARHAEEAVATRAIHL